MKPPQEVRVKDLPLRHILQLKHSRLHLPTAIDGCFLNLSLQKKHFAKSFCSFLRVWSPLKI